MDNCFNKFASLIAFKMYASLKNKSLNVKLTCFQALIKFILLLYLAYCSNPFNRALHAWRRSLYQCRQIQYHLVYLTTENCYFSV